MTLFLLALYAALLGLCATAGLWLEGVFSAAAYEADELDS
jgi:hypothetical protein